LQQHFSAMGTRVPYGFIQCYLPPGRGDVLAFFSTQVKLVLKAMQG